ncbi:MAG TPA: hypothetical protein VNL91_04765 [Thermoanaerobaculia bacterium]|nr:hypothetical protein [Thermoanaerobaculia bacterium]
MVRDERREFQRLRLDPSLPARLGEVSAELIEIGVLGARVVHDTPLSSVPVEIRFSRRANDIVLRCQVVRTVPHGPRWTSALRFLAAIGDSGDFLREMLSELVTRELERNRSAGPLAIGPAIDPDRTIRGKEASFLSYRLEDGRWQRRRVFLPEQPASGFTVARGEDSEEMQRLCSVYEASDDEGRRLIRMFAELSISEAMGIPPNEAPR